MLREVAALAGVGLVGGTAVVSYNDSGDATVSVTDEGKTRSVTLQGNQSGPTYSCPASAEDTLIAVDKRSGRIKLTLRDVRAELTRLDAQYPQKSAPAPVARRFNGLIKREGRLVAAFNESVDEHNAVLEDECSEK